MKKVLFFITASMFLMAAYAWAEDHAHEEHSDEHKSTTVHDHGGHGDEHDGPAAHDHEEHGDEHKGGAGHNHGEHGHEEGEPITLSAAQIKQAGIKTIVMQHQQETQTISAPGSVSSNAYNLADVTALIDSVVYARHVRLGDEVNQGQKLVTLTSSALAQAEADYLRALAAHRTSKLDLQRLKGLVKDKIVSQARFQQAQSNYQAAHANLAASKAALSSYGMNRKEIDSLLKATDYGQLTLRAPSFGTVTADTFRIGQHIAAGTRLLQIVDESTVWVEVKLAQSQVSGIHAGQMAMVSTKNNSTYQAKVVNVYHQLDLTTRTVGVRLEVQNIEDTLHPGMFVKVEIEAVQHDDHEVLLLPEQAIQRQGSELIVFVEEEAGKFERREVEVGKTSMGLVSILDGVKEGESVVVKGAFVLASELAKSGFAVHNH